ncbi:snaclec alboaggregin-D subunit alpha-like [Leucoraja erinacea]|uniref:snaclec alboaggregin-D subunit alpha-like n=1 Tax=Leucoraja erinaceus TaxID=7782 RepID=UPI002457E8E1|nr:snaclec alboaggregin-D subunit alpha-like [Leucoraja erinacea]
MMLVWVLVLTALLASDVAGATGSLETEETSSLIQGNCDPGWNYFERTCHRYYSEKRTWKSSLDACRELAHAQYLVTVTSAKHSKFIMQVIGKVEGACRAKPHAWIGLKIQVQLMMTR